MTECFFIDPAKLNKTITHPQDNSKVIEDLLCRLTVASKFTTADTNSPFWTINMDHESSDFTPSACMYGRYAFSCLPCGFSYSSDPFQK